MEALAKLRRSAPHLEFPALHKELFSVDGSWSEDEEEEDDEETPAAVGMELASDEQTDTPAPATATVPLASVSLAGQQWSRRQ